MTFLLGLIGSPLGRALGVLLAAGIVAGMIWRNGYNAAAARCEAASLRATIAAQDRDLKAQQEQASAYQRRAAEAERLADLTRKQIDDIKADEAARPAGACVYDDARARRLLDIGRTKKR